VDAKEREAAKSFTVELVGTDHGQNTEALAWVGGCGCGCTGGGSQREKRKGTEARKSRAVNSQVSGLTAIPHTAIDQANGLGADPFFCVLA
jgi:hypothetical protein